jgi:hypothetical protein
MLEGQGGLDIRCTPVQLAGKVWNPSAELDIEDCASFLLIVTPSSLHSSYITFEWAFAHARGKPITLITLNDIDLPPFLSEVARFDFRDEEPWYTLISHLRLQSVPAKVASVASELRGMAAISQRLEEPPSKSLGSVDTVPDLIQSMSDSDPQVRLSALSDLAQLGDVFTLPAVIDALQDENDRVRLIASAVLGLIGDAGAVPGLITALDDPLKAVRFNAVWSLGEIGDERALPALQSILKDTDNEVRLTAIWAMGQIDGGEVVLSDLIALLDDPSPQVQQVAARALAHIGTESALEALKNWNESFH